MLTGPYPYPRQYLPHGAAAHWAVDNEGDGVRARPAVSELGHRADDDQPDEGCDGDDDAGDLERLHQFDPQRTSCDGPTRGRRPARS